MNGHSGGRSMMQEQVDIRYLLRIYALGPHPELEISHEAFEGIKSSKAILNAGLSMEEKYEVLVSNYLEFEKEMLIYSAECMIRNNLNTDAFSKIKMDLNRRLVNIMTAARSYIDQVSRDIRSIVPHEIKENDFVKKALSDKYDELFEYRFMESLRNHVQHREFQYITWKLIDSGIMENVRRDQAWHLTLSWLQKRQTFLKT